MIDFWSEHPRALADIIITSLRENDLPTLRGIQCFSEATKWTYFDGVESIMISIQNLTIRFRREAEKYKERLKDDEHYKYLGTYAVLHNLFFYPILFQQINANSYFLQIGIPVSS